MLEGNVFASISPAEILRSVGLLKVVNQFRVGTASFKYIKLKVRAHLYQINRVVVEPDLIVHDLPIVGFIQ